MVALSLVINLVCGFVWWLVSLRVCGSFVDFACGFGCVNSAAV